MCGKAQHLVSSENVLLGQEQRCFVTFSPTFLGVSLHLSSYPSSHFWYGDFSHLGTWGSIVLGSSFLSLFAVLSYLHILAVLVRHLLTLLPMCIGHLALLLVPAVSRVQSENVFYAGHELALLAGATGRNIAVLQYNLTRRVDQAHSEIFLLHLRNSAQ